MKRVGRDNVLLPSPLFPIYKPLFPTLNASWCVSRMEFNAIVAHLLLHMSGPIMDIRYISFLKTSGVEILGQIPLLRLLLLNYA